MGGSFQPSFFMLRFTVGRVSIWYTRPDGMASARALRIWVCLKMLTKPPKNPMVLLIIIPIKWLFHWEYTLFSMVLLIRQSRFEKWLAIIGKINPTFSDNVRICVRSCQNRCQIECRNMREIECRLECQNEMSGWGSLEETNTFE